jgi:hypothetical protein
MTLMHRLVYTIALVAAVALAAPAVAAADWAPVQSAPLNGSTTASGVSAASLGGVPYVAWSQGPVYASSMYVDAISPDGASALGGAVGDCESNPQLAVVGSELELACQGAIDNDGMEVFGWNGSTWVQVASDLPGAENFAAVDGEPGMLVLGSGGLTLEEWNGSAWTQVGGTLLTHIGDSDGAGSQLIGDGATPVAVWAETDGSGDVSVYADQLEGSSWTALNGGASILPQTAVENDVDLDGGAVLDGTPYVSLDEQDSVSGFSFTAYVLKLSGTTLSPVGGPIVTGDQTVPQPTVGSDGNAPMVLFNDDDAAGEPELLADTLSGGSWMALGYQLGVPPLPNYQGAPYGSFALATDGSGTPYAAFLEQIGDNNFGDNNLYVEADTPGGKNPNAPFSPGTGSAPPLTVTTTLASPGGVLERLGTAALARHRRKVSLNSGVQAQCPAQSGHPRCRVRVTVTLRTTSTAAGRKARARTVVQRTSLLLASGKTRTIVIALSRRSIARLGGVADARLARGSVQIALTGPNGRTTKMAASVSRK